MRTVHLEHEVNLSSPVVTVGTFDGVHLGHASVLQTVRSEAAARSGTGVVVTFEPHPRTVISPHQAPSLLTTLEEKERRISDLGIDVLAVVGFTPALRELGPESFAEKYLIGFLRARAVVVGYDHGFGKDRSGGLQTMQALGERFGFDVYSVAPTRIGDEPVSSTRVRRLIESGDMEGAVRLLGSGYPVCGEVVHGDGRGRQIGFPTANVAFTAAEKLLPPDGVYAAWVDMPERRAAVLNLGVRPTFDGRSRSLEVHILGFDGDLYGRRLCVEMVGRIRGEQRFESRQALEAQIGKDVDAARKILSQIDGTLLRR